MCVEPGGGGAKKTVVLNVVALTKDYLSEEDTPNMWNFTNGGGDAVNLMPPLPAVTCVSQATYLTGVNPSEHGVTANGYYDEELKQIVNWHQSAGNVKAERLYAKLKKADPNATVFVHTWWHSMYDENIDYCVTVRPEYCSNGKKIPNSYTKPHSMRDQLHQKFGKYPLHRFWGPLTSIQSSRWIANTAMEVDKMHDPTLTMIYLPHLDYSLQKYGTDKRMKHVKEDLKMIDEVVGDLVSYYRGKEAEVVILSEYGISPVTRAVDINRVLRKAGYISVIKERQGETLDYGASRAFATVEHQVAHVHVNDKTATEDVRKLLLGVDGIAKVLSESEMDQTYHAGRCGDLLCVAEPDSWFTYYFWEEEKMAPDYAHCVDIHTKPGYDPTEMFLRFDKPVQLFGLIHLVFKAVLSQLVGIRTLVDATPTERASEIRGSHGTLPTEEKYMPLLSNRTIRELVGHDRSVPVPATDVCSLLMKVLLGK
ncbi:hypothetical protein NDN08_002274 [Rhodosorus marinus]|uniref:Alkaline phosphatase family protein n=1 Tax=Rhodosorus marinus TaxID=101924 RepID=A0AAV8UUP1_9RHOD|nr:hypothetical protein NDN08_002274 [Rhodosorus marinus]